MRFVDLFAGLGGFHWAMKRLGHTCVFACEIDGQLRQLYERNFRLLPDSDIRQVAVEGIPAHDILCAGFPCQPFSKAGEQKGMDCPRSGDLFKYVLKIIHHHKPDYLILENVPNLTRHDRGKTWVWMEAKLRAAGYAVDDHRLSPHRFGIPQIRERVFIVGARNGLTHFTWPDEKPENIASIISVLDDNPPEAKPLSPQVQRCLEVWQEFLQLFPHNVELPSFPIWSMEFGATYPFEDSTPYAIGGRGLKEYLGCHGRSLREVAGAGRLGVLPSYARTEEAHFPTWKIQFIRQNRALYQRHRKWIDRWMPTILEFPPSLQKFEWNCKGETRDLWKLVIQFRASGVRVKRPTTAPSLVAMTTTQVPIIGWEKRYMTPRECARLQSMDKLPDLPASATAAFKALGNAVNAKVVELIADRLCYSGKVNGVKRTGHNGQRVLAATPPARMSYAFDGRISQ